MRIGNYISKVWETMVVLKDGSIFEGINSFNCTNGSFWMFHNPLFHQIKAQLQIKILTHKIK